MIKKNKKTREKIFAFNGIFLMIMSLFAFSVIISDVGVVVSAPYDGLTTPPPPVTSSPASSPGLDSFLAQIEKTSKAALGPAAPPAAVNPGSLSNPSGWLFPGLTDELYKGLFNGAAHGLFVYIGIQILGPMLGFEETTTDALAISGSLGIFAGEVTYGAISEGIIGTAAKKGAAGSIKLFGDFTLSATQAGWIAGIGVAVITFILLYKEHDKKVVKFTCLPWQAPIGGSNCEECNKQAGGLLGCSEYQCKSLGQACEIVNPGTEEEKCVWVNRQDVNPPTIEPLESALFDDYRYSPDNAINPPDRGVKINYLKANDNCIPAFTPLSFGVDLNEPAKCKIDVLRKNDFESMSNFMSSGLLRYNHTYSLSLPGSKALEAENITVKNDGNYELYVRCEDANGNSNTATFLFKYCVDPGPDTTPPLIITTSVLNGVPIAFNKSSLDLEVYINEPSSCRWSHDDEDYENMDEQMTCSSSIFDFNAQMTYKCSTTLTGLKDKVDNNFYFRCKDKPFSSESDKNVNAESYEFTLKGTIPLVIDSISPDNETVKDSTDSVKVTLEVETSAGSDEGKSLCYYSNSGNENSYIKFFETESFTHKQDLFLTEGEYEYFIKCTDNGGNSDYENIMFEVETDTSAPIVVRAYKEENNLKLITDDEGECVYSTFSCSYLFDEGSKFTTIDDKNHFTSWDTQNDLYVKCRDNFGNQPNPDSCSVRVRASDY